MDQAGYDRALAAWQSGGGSSGTPLSFDAWHNTTNIRGQGNAARSAYDKYVNNFNKSGSGGARPDIADYTTSGGNPRFSADVNLSPEQQRLYEQQTQQSIGLSDLASALQSRVGTSLNQNAPGEADFNVQSKKAQDAYYENQKQYLDPQWEQSQKALDAKLAAQGITLGSEAYNTENNNFSRQRQSAYDTAQNNAILQGPQNAQQLFSLNAAARELPLNEFNALRSQSQVQMPSFAAPQPVGAAPTNTSQNTWNAYNAQQNAYNQQVASNNSTTSGLFGLGGSVASALPWATWLAPAAAASDIRLKTAIKLIKKVNGFSLCEFKYLGDDTLYNGVMAQEVELLRPDAVVKMDSGYLAVDYAKIGIFMERVH